MKTWPFAVKSTTKKEIRDAVHHEEWQRVRLHMKGMPTTDKLDILVKYRNSKTCPSCNRIGRITEVQIDNYINALKRGGQLNYDLEVVK